MAITLVTGNGGATVGATATKAHDGSNTTYTVSLTGLDIEEGDLVVVWYGTVTQGLISLSLPVGDQSGTYQELTTTLQGDDSRDTNSRAAYQFMGATPDTEITLPCLTDTAWGSAATVRVFRGVDSSTPLDVTTQVAAGTNTAAANPPSITPSTEDSIIIAGWSATGTNGQGAAGAPSPFESGTAVVGQGSTLAYISTLSYIATPWESGAVDPSALGLGGAANSWAAFTAALRPDLSGSEVEGEADLSGTGTLTASAEVDHNATAALSGAGSLAAAAEVDHNASASLSGTGTLTASAEADHLATASLSGAGTLTASAEVEHNASAALSGTGTLSAEGTVVGRVDGEAHLTGTGTLDATAEVEHNATAALSGTGTLSATGEAEHNATAALTGTGTLNATAEVEHNATVSLAGTGTLTATAEVEHNASASLTGTGTLNATGTIEGEEPEPPAVEEERFAGTPYSRRDIDRLVWEQQLEELLREDEEILCLV